MDADTPRPELDEVYGLVYDADVLVESVTGEAHKPTMTTAIRVVNLLADAGLLSVPEKVAGQGDAVEVVRRFIVEQVGFDGGDGMTDQAEQLVKRLAESGSLRSQASGAPGNYGAPGYRITLDSEQAARVRSALADLPSRCPYHGDDFETSGWWMGQPRCASCKPPWRMRRAAEAIGAYVRKTDEAGQS